MDFNEDTIYYSDDDSSDELFWSDLDGEDGDCRPLCIGCRCEQKTCESLMPLIGSVVFNSTLWDVKDYIELNARLLTIGVKLYYQCYKCQVCEDCIPAIRTFPKSLEHEERKHTSTSCPTTQVRYCLSETIKANDKKPTHPGY